MQCRQQCGACCIAPSIVQPYYNMPNGKSAGEMCVNLDQASWQCTIWGTSHYPQFCADFLAEQIVCGEDREEAIRILTELEATTKPAVEAAFKHSN